MKFTVLTLLVASATALFGQTTTGAVNGRATDSSRAAVPDARVSLVNVNTGLSLTTRSDSEGRYVFTLLQPSSYRLTVESAGFEKFAVQFDLAVNQTARVDATLTVGQVSESIEVAARPVLLENETSSLGQQISNRQVVDLPLNGRNPFGLAALTPGVNPMGSFGIGLNAGRSAVQMAGANNFMANGGVSGSNEILLDGVAITVCCQGQPALISSVDVTQEFKVQTNTSSAEFGRTSGGIINIVTKSGSNTLHGSAYEFIRNEKLDAANYFVNRGGRPPIPGRDDMRPPLRNNQFGFTVGGPMVLPKLYSGKDKTFFFGGYEGIYVRKPTASTITVPTAAMRAGNFSEASYEIYDPLTTRPDLARPNQYLRTPFPGRVVPANRQSDITKKHLSIWPDPVRAGIVNNYDYTPVQTDANHQINARIDHNFSPNYRLFGRFSNSTDDWQNVLFSQPNSWGQKVNAKTFVLDQVIVPSATLLFDLRYGLAQQRNEMQSGKLGMDPQTYGFPKSFGDLQQVPGISSQNVSGFAELATNNGPRDWSRYTHSVAATTTLIRPGHTIKFGWDGRLYRDNQISLDSSMGAFSYGTTFTSGADPRAAVPGGQAPYLSFASFLLGLPTGGSMTFNGSMANQLIYSGLFIQDDWKVNSKLTINVGLRWDVETGFTDRYDRIATFDPYMANPLGAQVGMDLRGGIVFAGVNGAARGKNKTDWNNFGPRFGFAYTPISKTVIRGGYGIFYLPTTQRGYGVSNPGFTVSTPFVSSIDGVNPVGSIVNPFPDGLLKPEGSKLGALSMVGAGASGMYYDTPVAYTQQWNFGVQRELPAGVLLSLVYAGNHGVKLPMGFNINAINPIYFGAIGDQTHVGYLNQTVANPFYGHIATGALATTTVQRNVLLRASPQFTSASVQHVPLGQTAYNAFQLSAQRRMSQGLFVLVGYTFAKNIGIAENLTTGFMDVGSPGFQNDYARAIERSVLASDIKNRFVVSANYDLPFGKGRRFGSTAGGVLNQIIGGWKVNGIATVQSGFPINFAVSGAQPYAGSRPSFVAGQDPLTSGDTHDRLESYFNKAAFRLPLSFEFGDVPRLTDNIREPGTRNLDLSLLKDFPIREAVRLQFRAESFNVLNNVKFGAPADTFNAASFGVISSQSNQPRQVQLALKLIW